jgi:hypothetical protein
MLAGLLSALPFIALSFVVANSTPAYRSFSKAKDA